MDITEKQLINNFIKLYSKRNSNCKIELEVWNDGYWTDIVIYKKNKKIAVEAKLENILKVLVQAINNKENYDKSYVIMPKKKAKVLQTKWLEYFKKYNIGLITVDENNYKFLNQ